MSETNNTKQAAWVAIGSFCSFGIGIVSSMILSRYFNKADYGTYKQVLYVYHTLLTVFTLGLPKAFSYFLPRVESNQAKSLISKLTNIFFVLGALFSLLLYFGSSIIAEVLNNPDLDKALRLFAVVPMLLLPTMGLEGILSTYRKTQFLAIYTIITRTLMLLCIALPVMLFNFGYMEAIMGFVVSSAITCALALILKYYPVRNEGKEKCNISIREILQFSLPLLYASFWGIIIASADQFFISRYFGNEVFAEFSNGSMELPFIGMIVGACSTVLSPIFSRLKHEQVDFKAVVYPLWINVFEKTAKIIYPLLAFCWVFSEPIMVLLYGQQYACSSIYFKIKTISNIFNLIIFAPLLINTGKVKYYANVHILTALTVVILEYISVYAFYTPYAIAVISLLCQLGKIFLLLNVVAHMFQVSILQLFPIRIISLVLIPSLIILYILYYLMKNMHVNNLMMLVCGFIIYIIIFGLYAYYKKLNYISIVRPLFSKKLMKQSNIVKK